MTAGAIILLLSKLGNHLFTGQLLVAETKAQTAAKNYIGIHSGRDSQHCRNIIGRGYSSEALFDKCSTKKPRSPNSDRFLVFIGDSHSGMLMPLSEELFAKDNVQTVDLFNDGCTIPQLDIAQGMCTHMNSAIVDMAKRYKNRVVFVVSSNFIGPDNYINDTIKLAEEVTSYGSDVIALLPNPIYPGLADGDSVNKDICQIQWFRPSFALGEQCNNCFRINRGDNLYSKERLYYASRLEGYARVNRKFFVYDLFEDLCFRYTPLDGSCSPYKNGKLMYYDSNHINTDGAKSLYPRFKSFLEANSLI